MCWTTISHVLSVTNVCWCCLRNLFPLSLLSIVIVANKLKPFSLPSCFLASSIPFTVKLPEWCVNVDQFMSFLFFSKSALWIKYQTLTISVMAPHGRPLSFYPLSLAHYDSFLSVPQKKPNSLLSQGSSFCQIISPLFCARITFLASFRPWL